MSAKEELIELQKKRDEIEARIEAIYAASVNAPPEEKVCDDHMAGMLGEHHDGFVKYPIQVSGIAYGKRSVIDSSRKNVGSFVAIRLADKSSENKTYLGIYIGDVALQAGALVHKNTGVMELVHLAHNPAIWVPDLKRVVFGCESWWGVLKVPEDLKQITDADIDDIWYVKAMKSLSGASCSSK